MKQRYLGPERREQNGSKTIMLWIMGALTSVTLLFVSTLLNSVNQNLNDIVRELNVRQVRLTSNEAKIATIHQRLDTIEIKIDRMLDKFYGKNIA